MTNEVPKMTVTVLLILVVMISVVGTWVLLSEISTLEPQQSSSSPQQKNAGEVGFEYKEPISTQGKVSFTIEEVEK